MITSNAVLIDKVSDTLIVGSRDRGDPISNLKLQKLLYYAQAWYLALHDDEIFQEDFQAWIHGPVLPSQYHRFKHNGWMPISDKPRSVRTGSRKLDNHLERIVDEFGSETPVALELMTHRERPWIEARRGLPSTMPSTNVISKVTMKKFYKQLAQAA